LSNDITQTQETAMSYATEQGILNGQWNAAEMAFQTEVARSAPHVLMRPILSVDGNMYCALYGADLVQGCAGFGETVAAAMADFDKNWREAKAPNLRHGIKDVDRA
jgi:hypothetical protein